MEEDRRWAVVKKWYRDEFREPEKIYYAAVYKPEFGAKLNDVLIAADNLTKEEALALIKLLGE